MCGRGSIGTATWSGGQHSLGVLLRWSRTSRVGDGRAAVAARPRSPAVRAPHDVDAGDGVASSTASAAVTSAASFPFLRVLSGSTEPLASRRRLLRRRNARALESESAPRPTSRQPSSPSERRQSNSVGKALEQMAAARVEWVGPACCTPRTTFASVPVGPHRPYGGPHCVRSLQPRP